jgi:hypothetical protein
MRDKNHWTEQDVMLMAFDGDLKKMKELFGKGH